MTTAAQRRAWGLGATVVVVLALVAGFRLMDGPARARIGRLDARRLEDLSTLRGRIDQYWRDHRALPAALDDSLLLLPDTTALRDPDTGVRYRFEAGADSSYRLCAVFGRASDRDGMPDWSHPAGEHCFALTVGH